MPTKAKTETVPEAINTSVTQNGGWRPEPGDRLTGKVVDITTGGEGSEYGRYPIVVLATKDGDVAVHAFHFTLRNRLREMRPKIGHTLDIVFHGEEEQTNKNGDPILAQDGSVKTLNRYSVDSPEFEFNWDAI